MKIVHFILFFLSVMLLHSCYEREEGCLDLLAKDYTISSDDACDECCTYPEIQFRLSHMVGDTSWTRDTVLVNTFGQSYQIRDAVILISNLVMDIGGVDEGIIEKANYESPSGEFVELNDDHQFFRPVTSLLNIGSIRENGEVNFVSFDVGVPHNYIAINEESPLYNYDTLYTDEGYYDISLYLKIGDSLQIDKIVRMELNTASSQILLPLVDVNKIIRTDFGLQLSIDYEKLLENVMIEETQDVQIVNDFNLPNEFISLTE